MVCIKILKNNVRETTEILITALFIKYHTKAVRYCLAQYLKGVVGFCPHSSVGVAEHRFLA